MQRPQTLLSYAGTKKISSAVETRTRKKLSFSRCYSCVERAQLSVCLPVCRSLYGFNLVSQRHLEAHLRNCKHIWTTRPPYLLPFLSSSSSSFHSFFVSSNYKHMPAVFPPAAAKPIVCNGVAFPSELSTLACWEIYSPQQGASTFGFMVLDSPEFSSENVTVGSVQMWFC